MVAGFETLAAAIAASPAGAGRPAPSAVEVAGGFLRSAVELNPEHPVLLLALGIQLYEDQGAESDREAEALFDRMIESEPDHPVAQWYKSLVLARRGEVALAVERLRLVQDLVAADPRASSVVADLIERLTSPDEAAQTPESDAQ